MHFVILRHAKIEVHKSSSNYQWVLDARNYFPLDFYLPAPLQSENASFGSDEEQGLNVERQKGGDGQESSIS